MSSATHYQTVAAAEEQHLAAMSTTTATSSTTTSTKTGKVKTTKKVSSKKLSSATSIEISTDSNKTSNKVKDLKQQQQQQQQETICAEESVISQETSTMTVSNGSVQQKSKTVKKKSTSAAIAATSTNMEYEKELQTEQSTAIDDKNVSSIVATVAAATTTSTNGKKKTKKSKKTEAEKENISVKSSFSKFDALQKKNLIHVRSSDAGKAQEKFSEPQTEKERNCRLCSKPVYKMEEIKAEKSIFHKNCFRCQECDKQLKVDNYQSHEGVLYCMVHFKLLFAPKFVEDSAPEKPRKPELIIRENQPVELPPDVVRASDKPDLGLEELQQLNLRSKFQVFENGSQKEQHTVERSPSNAGVKRSASILSKMAKLQARGFTTGLSMEHHEVDDEDDDSSSASGSDQDESGSDDGDDRALVRSKKRTQRERPVGLGNAMNDIKTKFEKGHVMSKEERREERKQEIQNIRSRLFMGKQARIKEMYQQAVADSEQSITSVGKKSEIDIGDKARSLKERFEKGEMFKEYGAENENEGAENGNRSAGVHVDDADVFESAISKKSRSIFMELDANAAAGKNRTLLSATAVKQQQGIQRNPSWGSNRFSESEQESSSTFQQQQENVVKHDEKPEDIKIETSEISSKFKFFETYRPTESKKKEFRITPPRDGVVKLPTPESDNELDDEGHAKKSKKSVDADAEIIGKTHTASTMLNKFREMEQRKNGVDAGPRPLKCFTPPPDGGRRLYQEQESSEEFDEEDEGEEEEDGEEECEEEEEDEHKYRRSHVHLEDEALKEAQAAARAKQLRAKFEKWEANEIQREINDGCVNIYSDQVSDETNIESTKSIRERFENMKNLERGSPTRPRYQVNRFV